MSEKTVHSMQSIEFSRKPLFRATSNALKRISKRKGPALITFWGNKGVGKSVLLDQIARYTRVDLQAEVVEIPRIKELSLEQIKEMLQQKLLEISAGKVIVLLDDLDELLRKDKNSQDFFDFERDSILPLIERGDVLILATSQIELNQWREDDVRVRQVNYQIPPLTSKQVAVLLDRTGFEAKQAYELTLGHPKVASWLQEKPTLSERDLASQAWTYFLEDMPPDAMSIAEIIYQFPVFNIFILQKTYERLTEVQLGYLDCLERIKEYIRRGLLYWDVSIGSYRFTDSAVRRLLARQILFEKPAKFHQVQRIASDYFKSEAQSPGYLHIHFVSAIYHMAQAGRNLSQAVRGQECLDWFHANKVFWLSTRWADVLAAWKGGAGEPAVCEEIRELIGSKQFNAITREIKEARKFLEVKK